MRNLSFESQPIADLKINFIMQAAFHTDIIPKSNNEINSIYGWQLCNGDFDPHFTDTKIVVHTVVSWASSPIYRKTVPDFTELNNMLNGNIANTGKSPNSKSDWFQRPSSLHSALN